MGRIQIELPEKRPFTHTITTRVTDLNYGGHVGNDRFLAYAQEASAAYFHSLGYTETNLRQEMLGIIMSDSAVVYKKEVFAGEALDIEIGAMDRHKYGFDLICTMKSRSHGQEVARAKSGMICFDYDTRKVAILPQKIVAALGFE